MNLTRPALESLAGNWNYPTTIRFGVGRITELADACRTAGIERPLLVTDPALASLEMVGDAVTACRGAGLVCGLFHDLQPNPVETNVTAGVAAYRDGGHDGVVAFGGGSALDTGKAIALMVGQTRSVFDFEDREDWHTRANANAIAPIVAVPTTSGTGSEVGRAAVITDEGDHTKKIIFHPRMMPTVVILDPALTVGLPAHLTAAVGMDALSHNLEAWCSPVYHPIAQGVALQGMRLIKEWLPRAVEDGSDLHARAHMQVASSMGATAFQKGLGAMHALSHPVGAVYGAHHGLTNAVVMPYVLAFNRPAVDDLLADLGRCLALTSPTFEGVLEWVLGLREQIGIPHTLGVLDVAAGDIEQLARRAARDPAGATNPVALDARAARELYRLALEGELRQA
jgi:alcohol dehydrogenase class IV